MIRYGLLIYLRPKRIILLSMIRFWAIGPTAISNKTLCLFYYGKKKLFSPYANIVCLFWYIIQLDGIGGMQLFESRFDFFFFKNGEFDFHISSFVHLRACDKKWFIYLLNHKSGWFRCGWTRLKHDKFNLKDEKFLEYSVGVFQIEWKN